MAFPTRRRRAEAQGPVIWIWDMFAATVGLVARFTISTATLAVLAGALLVIRLVDSPLELPAVGRMIAEQASEQSGMRIGVGMLALQLSDDQSPSGLQFRDVSVATAEGEPLFAIPRVATQFHLADLVRGRIRPVRISVIGADAQFIRAADGPIRFGLGTAAGIALEDSDTAVTTDAGADAISEVIDSFVGDSPPIAELTELRTIEIIGARVVYDDRRGGGTWSSHGADLRIDRDSGGARAVLKIDDIGRGELGAALRVFADRRRGTGRIDLRASFGRLETGELAQKLPGLGWMEAFAATLEGALTATVGPAGEILALEGEVLAERGVVRTEPEQRFDVAAARFRLERETGRVHVDSLRLSGPELEASVAALVEAIDTGPDDRPGLRAQIEVSRLRVHRPEMFDEAVVFESGQVLMRWVPEAARIDVRDSWLATSDITVGVDGTIAADAEDPVVSLRAHIPRMTVAQLVRYWPKDAATNARTWIAEHIPEADVLDLTAQARIGDGTPRLALDFGYADLVTEYITGMSPIEGARGTAHVSFDEMHLEMAEGQVSPGRGRTLDIAGSHMVITDFWEEVTPGDINVSARGEVGAVLDLIDQAPLHLVRKLGIDLGDIAGNSEVTARLRFPLIAALRVAEVDVSAEARVTGVGLSLPLGGAAPLRVDAQTIEITADTESLHLAGTMALAGHSARVEWRENYGEGRSGRTVALAGGIGPELIGLIGIAGIAIEGSAPARLELSQRGGEPVGFALRADLAPVRLRLAELDWTKASKAPGTLSIDGSLGPTLRIDAFSLRTDTLKAAGSAELTGEGELVAAAIERLQLPGLIDAAIRVEPGQDGVREVRIIGRALDVADRIDSAGQGEAQDGAPVRLWLEVERLGLSERIALLGARGRLVRDRQGRLTGEVDGRLGQGPETGIRIGLDLPGTGPGQVTLQAGDAGAVLRAAELYRDVRGGRLTLTARVGATDGPELTGEARIEDVRVRSDATFRNVLHDGGLAEAEAEVAGGGIKFREIVIPFSYNKGLVELHDAIAVSPSLGLKLSGILDERSESIDMVGVLSPAYGLTGALNDIPLIGQILSGGRGEGILAMTFTLKGAMRDPQFTVNPLSLLTPGVLRRIFMGRGGDQTDFKPPRPADR